VFPWLGIMGMDAVCITFRFNWCNCFQTSNEKFIA